MIEKLKKGIERDIKNPSSRFKSHTLTKDVPAYLEDYWTWDLVPEFKDFVYNSPYAKIASELMSAKKINLVMDNWFLREGGSKSSTPFHHDISYFDMDGTMVDSLPYHHEAWKIFFNENKYIFYFFCLKCLC